MVRIDTPILLHFADYRVKIYSASFIGLFELISERSLNR